MNSYYFTDIPMNVCQFIWIQINSSSNSNSNKYEFILLHINSAITAFTDGYETTTEYEDNKGDGYETTTGKLELLPR